MSRILVVGVDSTLGAALAREFIGSGHETIGTSRRPDAPAAAYLDLADPPEAWPSLDADVAFLCAARTSVDDCENDPRETGAINVEGSGELARRLAARGAFVCMPSTTLSFDGERGDYGPNETPEPRCEYGRQKVELEQIVLRAGGAIVRLGKVVPSSGGLFNAWLDAFASGAAVDAFENVPVAPVSLQSAINVLSSIARERERGSFHFTAARDISYFEAARELAAARGASLDLVRARRAPAGRLIPRFTALDSTATQRRFGIRVPQPADAIRALATRIRS